jgi:hypothetical protein
MVASMYSFQYGKPRFTGVVMFRWLGQSKALKTPFIKQRHGIFGILGPQFPFCHAHAMVSSQRLRVYGLHAAIIIATHLKGRL